MTVREQYTTPTEPVLELRWEEETVEGQLTGRVVLDSLSETERPAKILYPQSGHGYVSAVAEDIYGAIKAEYERQRPHPEPVEEAQADNLGTAT